MSSKLIVSIVEKAKYELNKKATMEKYRTKKNTSQDNEK